MANRNWMNGGKIFSMHASPVMMTCTIAIGASGAVSSFAGAAITSVTRNGTGLYTIAFQPQTTFRTMIGASGSAQSPVSGLSGVLAIEIQNAPSTAAQSGTCQIKTLDAAGALVNPADGSSINVVLMYNNSRVPSKAT